MTREELKKYLGNYVGIMFKSDKNITYIGTLTEGKYFKNTFYLGEVGLSFKVSHVYKITKIKENKMLPKEEVVKWLVENCMNENNNIDLSDLDFTPYNCSVDISKMKVGKHLLQCDQEIKGNLFFTRNKTRAFLDGIDIYILSYEKLKKVI